MGMEELNYVIPMHTAWTVVSSQDRLLQAFRQLVVHYAVTAARLLGTVRVRKALDVFQYSIITIIALCHFNPTNTARLHKIFQFLDGFRSEHNLAGYLHIGNDYSVFLIAPKAHDKYLQYELYETKQDFNEIYKPTLLAVSQIPVEYLKSQLKIFREELHRAKYVDYNVVPGTQVKTVREWQIKKAILENRLMLEDLPVLRSIIP